MITTPPKVSPQGPIRSHLKVVTKTEEVPVGEGGSGVLCFFGCELK